MLSRNAILGVLDAQSLSEVREAGRLVELMAHEQIQTANERIGMLLFPLDSTLSVVTHMKNGTTVEVGTIGREGTSGFDVLLGGGNATFDCTCLLPGNAVQLSTEAVGRLLATNVQFRLAAQGFLRAYLAFTSQLVACNRLHSIYQRSARWLLLSHDRAGRDRIPLTHEYLAMMLGSRRSGVSVALAKLKESGSISYGTGYVMVGDRRRLEDAACECYEVVRARFATVTSFAT
jgi:CRP-like cAMP-binding protein